MRLIDNLTSYLGSRNPFSHAYNAETDELWLFDNTAYRSPRYPHRWMTEVVAAYFRRGSGRDIGKVVADVAEKLGIAKGSREEAIVRERLQPFVDAILPARTVEIAIDGDKRKKVKLGSSGRSGISSDLVKLQGDFKDGQWIESHAIPDPTKKMATRFAEPKGWAIISDVDDTIKITMTSSPLGILRTTFIDIPQPISTMPELYEHINRRLRSPAWFYLSASPYNLYTFLHNFITTHYPAGTIILRDASWMTLGGFLSSLTVGTQDYKTSRIEKIQRWFPQRKFLCIGDSTQTDPESYGEMYRKFGGGWIKGIFIRKVLDVAEINKTDKNTDERFEKAFKGVPRDVWRTFVDPKELWEDIDRLLDPA
ncbi:MAG: hypothetical protein M1816_005564 [Peltula sp. TS41687]|nr:MAG: hypothetical protein M1816_005564 [Peltula sp. TS41687]